MYKNRMVFGVFVLVLVFTQGCQSGWKHSSDRVIAIVPKPVHMDINRGAFEVTRETKICVDSQTEFQGEMLNALLSPPMGFSLDVTESMPVRNSIQLSVDTSLHDLDEEGYQLTVTKNRILIEASTSAGIFYGIQTMRQLLPVAVYQSHEQADIRWNIPCVEIEDYPRFEWRGMHLDVCRHFMPKEFIMKFIDLLSIHKMNRFHWHLTEDQGWRIEIKKYPDLTNISAWRDETLIGSHSDEPARFDGQIHGGFYTQEEIREIVAYAQERYVTIVPEIELPGHSQAALSAYPELSCTGGPFKVETTWGIFKEVYCAGNEQTFEFLRNVLQEVISLFPGEYIHIGGDECPKDRWKECPKCQARIQSEGLLDEHELQSYFIKRIDKYLISENRRLIGWDEILEGGLVESATVMSWQSEEGGISAARAGNDVIMTPINYTYFNFYQSDSANEPLAYNRFLPLEKVYAYDPVPDELNEQQKSHILGVQGQLWTEYISTPEMVEYMAFPRACAMAEIAWTPDSKKDYLLFLETLHHHLKRLEFLKVNFRKID